MKRLALALLATLALTAPAFADATLAPEISLEDLKKAVESKSAIIIDANGEDMYKSGHIPGAIHFAKVEGKLESVLPQDKSKMVIAYCGGPMCTAWQEAAKEAKAKSYTNLRHFKGGIKGWKDAKQPVEKT